MPARASVLLRDFSEQTVKGRLPLASKQTCLEQERRQLDRAAGRSIPRLQPQFALALVSTTLLSLFNIAPFDSLTSLRASLRQWPGHCFDAAEEQAAATAAKGLAEFLARPASRAIFHCSRSASKHCSANLAHHFEEAARHPDEVEVEGGEAVDLPARGAPPPTRRYRANGNVLAEELDWFIQGRRRPVCVCDGQTSATLARERRLRDFWR